MESGFISLQILYDTIVSNKGKGGPSTPDFEKKPYRKAAKLLCNSIPQTQGFYLWGRFEKNGLWKNIYIGKTGSGLTSHLHARIKEELHDEACCIRIHVYSYDDIKLECSARYLKHFHRALRKSGATHIVWVADPVLKNIIVHQIESDLIETMSPRGNKSRPVPPSMPQDHTLEVVKHFRQQIHLARSRKFFLPDHFQTVEPYLEHP